MQEAQNGPRIDENPVGPRHWVADGPVGYKQGMSNRMRGRDQEKSLTTAAPQPPRELKTAGHADGVADGMRQRGTGHRGVANQSERGKMADSSKQHPCEFGAPVAMEW